MKCSVQVWMENIFMDILLEIHNWENWIFFNIRTHLETFHGNSNLALLKFVQFVGLKGKVSIFSHFQKGSWIQSLSLWSKAQSISRCKFCAEIPKLYWQMTGNYGKKGNFCTVILLAQYLREILRISWQGTFAGFNEDFC